VRKGAPSRRPQRTRRPKRSSPRLAKSARRAACSSVRAIGRARHRRMSTVAPSAAAHTLCCCSRPTDSPPSAALCCSPHVPRVRSSLAHNRSTPLLLLTSQLRSSVGAEKNMGCSHMMCGTKAGGSIKDAMRNGGCAHE